MKDEGMKKFIIGVIIGEIIGLVYATCSLHFIHHLF